MDSIRHPLTFFQQLRQSCYLQYAYFYFSLGACMTAILVLILLLGIRFYNYTTTDSINTANDSMSYLSTTNAMSSGLELEKRAIASYVKFSLDNDPIGIDSKDYYRVYSAGSSLELVEQNPGASSLRYSSIFSLDHLLHAFNVLPNAQRSNDNARRSVLL